MNTQSTLINLDPNEYLTILIMSIVKDYVTNHLQLI